MELQVDCIEIASGDKLIGYAIKFSGGWDGWVVRRNNRMLAELVANNKTEAEAVQAVKEA